jgi:hypothetical protein
MKNRKYRIALAIAFLLILILRETGIININLQRSSNQLRAFTSRMTINNDKCPILTDKIKITPSIFDYLPLYKTRSLKGEISNISASGSKVEYKYETRTTVIGICSGHGFREIIRKSIVNDAKKK